ncbi:MAG: hypothetical protein ACO1SV_11330 [Fimbriimonas sp.]
MRGLARGVAFGGATLGVLGGYGYVQSRGGWSEMTQMPAKRDASTPAEQSGFELIGIARVTAEDRSSRLELGDVSLGGTSGTVGSTRIWFRLPPHRPGERRVPSDEDLSASITFSDGEVYETKWEMADLAQRIATLQIPSGYPPTQWFDVNVRMPNEFARWRLTYPPKSPKVAENPSSDAFRAEGVELRVAARRAPRQALNTGLHSGLVATGYLDTHLRKVAATDSKYVVRVRYDRFIPEHYHPADANEFRSYVPPILPGPKPFLSELTFPYADRLKAVAVEGHLEVIDVVTKPLELPNARWEGSVFAGVRLTSDLVKVTDGIQAQLFDFKRPYEPIERPVITGRLFVNEGNSAASDWQIGPVAVDPAVGDWKAKLSSAMKRGGNVRVPLGTVRGSLINFQTVRRVPFRLVVPIGKEDPQDPVRLPQSKRAFPAVLAWPRISRSMPAKPH